MGRNRCDPYHLPGLYYSLLTLLNLIEFRNGHLQVVADGVGSGVGFHLGNVALELFQLGFAVGDIGDVRREEAILVGPLAEGVDGNGVELGVLPGKELLLEQREDEEDVVVAKEVVGRDGLSLMQADDNVRHRVGVVFQGVVPKYKGIT